MRPLLLLCWPNKFVLFSRRHLELHSAFQNRALDSAVLIAPTGGSHVAQESPLLLHRWHWRAQGSRSLNCYILCTATYKEYNSFVLVPRDVDVAAIITINIHTNNKEKATGMTHQRKAAALRQIVCWFFSP